MWFLIVLGLLFGGSTEAPASGASPPADLTVSSIRGEALARRECAACHAVGAADESPNPKAPRFRDLADRYPVENLQEALAEGIMVAHDAPMPTFTLDPGEIADLIAYLETVQDEAHGGARRP